MKTPSLPFTVHHARVVEFSKSATGRAYFAAWGAAHAEALRQFPKPRADGFYSPDRKAAERDALRDSLLFRTGFPQSAVNSGRIATDFKATYRPHVLAVAALLGITHAKSARTASVAAECVALAVKNHATATEPNF